MREQTIAILDVGSSKICCFIAEYSPELDRPRVIGIGHRESRGLNLGSVVDMEETENAIRTAVDAAEKMAGGDPIEDVTVNISAGDPQSTQLCVEVEVAGHEISDGDIERVLDLGRHYLSDQERFVLHSRPTSFRIDGVGGVRDPKGMFGEQLGVEMHVTSAAISPLRNLQTCVNRCHLNMVGIVFSPYASGLSTLVADELELGSICIDMGGGITSIAAFKDNEFIFGEPVKSIGTTFCIWQIQTDNNWRIGKVKLPNDDYKDGSIDLLQLLDGKPLTYKNWAEEYYEENFEDNELKLELVEKIYNGETNDFRSGRSK